MIVLQLWEEPSALPAAEDSDKAASEKFLEAVVALTKGIRDTNAGRIWY